MRKNFCLSKPIRLVVPALLLGFLLLAVPGCEFFSGESSVTSKIKQETGVDVSSPAQVALAAVGAKVLGSQEQGDALDVLKGYQRAKHELAGDNQYRYPPLARDEYKKALEWSSTSTANQRKKTAEIHGKIGDTYYREALTAEWKSAGVNDPAYKADLHRHAASKYRSAAATVRRAIAVDPNYPFGGNAAYFDELAQDQEALAKQYSAG